MKAIQSLKSRFLQLHSQKWLKNFFFTTYFSFKNKCGLKLNT